MWRPTKKKVYKRPRSRQHFQGSGQYAEMIKEARRQGGEKAAEEAVRLAQSLGGQEGAASREAKRKAEAEAKAKAHKAACDARNAEKDRIKLEEKRARRAAKKLLSEIR